jgi:hypothetical protein
VGIAQRFPSAVRRVETRLEKCPCCGHVSLSRAGRSIAAFRGFHALHGAPLPRLNEPQTASLREGKPISQHPDHVLLLLLHLLLLLPSPCFSPTHVSHRRTEMSCSCSVLLPRKKPLSSRALAARGTAFTVHTFFGEHRSRSALYFGKQASRPSARLCADAQRRSATMRATVSKRRRAPQGACCCVCGRARARPSVRESGVAPKRDD